MSILADSLGLQQTSLFVAPAISRPIPTIGANHKTRHQVISTKPFGFNKYTLSNKRFDFQPLSTLQMGNSEISMTMMEKIKADEKMIQGPIHINSKAIIHSYDEETEMVDITDSLGNNFKIQPDEIKTHIREKYIDGNNLSDNDFSVLEPWIYSEEEQKHAIEEYVMQEDLTQTSSDKMMLPTYFQDLFEEFASLNNFNLKDVIYSKSEQERFMKAVKQEIEQKQSITPLKKRELWKVIKESRFAIILGVLVTVEGFFELAAGAIPLSSLSYLRTGIYVAMTQEGLQRGTQMVKRDKVQRQYKEVADEVENLRSIILSVAEDEQNRNIKDKVNEKFADKNLGYSEKNQNSPWWWPFMINVDNLGVVEVDKLGGVY